MTEVFIQVLNMSISALWLILAVLVLRFVLKKAPKWVRVLLWGFVAVRLLCPFSVESAMSLIPSAKVVSPQILLDITPTLETGITPVDQVLNQAISGSNTPEIGASINPLQVTFAVISLIWFIGVVLMLVYVVVSYLLLQRTVKTAIRIRENFYQSECIETPFVLGIFRPRIYMPFQIDEENIAHVIAHEKAHIRRKDHWWKPLGFLLLAIHWFNPLVWLAYILLCRDIELACDEKVIKHLKEAERADYSAALLSCSVNRKMIAACPVAFGEVDVKTRVESVLSYKKPAFWVILFAVIACIAVAVSFLTDPVTVEEDPDLYLFNYESVGSIVADREEIQVIYCPVETRADDSLLCVGHVKGADLARYLDECQWRKVNGPADVLSSPGSVEFVIEDTYRVTVYDRKKWSLRSYAKVSFENDVRYYATSASDYAEVLALLDIYDTADEESESSDYYSYDLLIGAKGVVKIQVTTAKGTEIQRNALALTYREGQKVHLKALDGIGDLRGVSITALNRYGEVVYAFSVPKEATNQEIMDRVIQDSWLLAPTVAIGAEDDGQFYHIISAEGVTELKLSGMNFSGGCINADGSAFQYGERVWLEPLDGFTDLEDVTVTALDKDGNVLYGFLLIPNGMENPTMETENDNADTEGKVMETENSNLRVGMGFSGLEPNTEMVSDFIISLNEEANTVSYNITWARPGLTLVYGMRESDGTEYIVEREGGYDIGAFEEVPAGQYRLFVRNTDYGGVPAYENPEEFPDVDFNATGAINYYIE